MDKIHEASLWQTAFVFFNLEVLTRPSRIALWPRNRRGCKTVNGGGGVFDYNEITVFDVIDAFELFIKDYRARS